MGPVAENFLMTIGIRLASCIPVRVPGVNRTAGERVFTGPPWMLAHRCIQIFHDLCIYDHPKSGGVTQFALREQSGDLSLT
jgi:hypothetical protein